MSFAAATTARKVSEGRYLHQIPDGWQQGPGAFGGLVLGLLTRCALDFENDATRPFRAVSGAVLSPVTVGEAEITARLLRRGSGLSAVNVQLAQNGKLAATADVVLARSRVSDGDWQTLDAPKLSHWDQVEVLPMGPPFAPVFTPHFEYRAMPPLPLAGVPQREAHGWVRARAPGGPCDVPLVVGLADAWWPAPYSAFTEPRPMSTVAFSLQLFLDPSTLDATQPLMYRASNPLAAGGYTLELRELWTADGRAVAQNQQTFVMIK
ncbi:MAG: thioesterase family protein [Archangiaceae bacterium]|nr:thioesterase family protein [Archangiaceae bacterium]